MKLSFHGATYTYAPKAVETIETNIECRFMGSRSKLRVVKRMPSEHARHSLKYRGIGYQA
ncbi:MAG: DUF4278 domain-containing protein [Cyanobacteria bacterium J06554_11]